MPSNIPAELPRKDNGVSGEQRRKKRLLFAAQHSTPDTPSSPAVSTTPEVSPGQLPPSFKASILPIVEDPPETRTLAKAEATKKDQHMKPKLWRKNSGQWKLKL